jgi:hypothetical protein
LRRLGKLDQPAFGGVPAGLAGADVTVTGRVFGELDLTGVQQSGPFIRSPIHLGFNQDEEDRQVVDGASPRSTRRGASPARLRSDRYLRN